MTADEIAQIILDHYEDGRMALYDALVAAERERMSE